MVEYRSTTRQAGFTLVELLVATTLLALLSVALFGGLRFGARAWEAGGESIERTAEVTAVQELLRRTLAEAYPPQPTEAEPRPMLGNSDRISFVAPLPQHIGVGGLGRYQLGLGDAGEVLLAWEPQQPEQRLEAPISAKPAVILQGVTALAIAYYGADRPGEAPAWRDRWSGRVLPLLIRIVVTFAEDDRRPWPELTIAPRLANAVSG